MKWPKTHPPPLYLAQADLSLGARWVRLSSLTALILKCRESRTSVMVCLSAALQPIDLGQVGKLLLTAETAPGTIRYEKAIFFLCFSPHPG
jgi:hypothetical protein